jgi:thiosulfate/3-mercaptopyruvate sulfurtransferase
VSDKGYAQADVLVTTEWVAENLAKTDKIRLVESNEDVLLYSTGHIPNAVHIDWVADLNDAVRRDYLERRRIRRSDVPQRHCQRYHRRLLWRQE